jgi:3-oxoacyl-[acyl-carrier-protein] synthase-1
MAAPPAARGPVEVSGWADATGRAVHVFATSAWNGLGATPHQVWAFRRAELAVHAETPFRLTDGERATMLHIRTLPPRAQGVDRLLPVLRALLAPLLPRAASLGQRARVAVVLALAERLATAKAEVRRLEAAADGDARAAGLEPGVLSVPRGHAGLAFALPGVCAALAAGRIEAAIVGGIDTCYDADAVDALLAAGRLYDGKNLESFIPGEGGAFLLLSRADLGRPLRWSAPARLEAVAYADEPAATDADAPITGEALTRAVRAICDPLEAAGRKVDWWLSDLTHERDRVREWQLVMPRAMVGVSEGEPVLELLAPFLGDLGAAALPTALVLAAEGFTRGDPPTARTCLACASSAGPARGAVLLSSAVAPTPARDAHGGG